MLHGSAAEVWLLDKQRQAHRRIYDAILGVRTLDVIDAAALLLHAFAANDESRLMHCARVLEGIDEKKVSSAIYHQLLWLPLVALVPGQRFFDANPSVSAALRHLQFSVALLPEGEGLFTPRPPGSGNTESGAEGPGMRKGSTVLQRVIGFSNSQ